MWCVFPEFTELAVFDVNTIITFRVNVSATDESDLLKEHKSGTSQKDKTIEEKIIAFCHLAFRRELPENI